MLEAKHSALLDEAQRRGHTGVAQLRLCFQLLSLSSAIDRDCATRLAPHGLSEGRFTVLFLLHGAGGTLPPHELAERAGVTRATISGLIDGLQQSEAVHRVDGIEARYRLPDFVGLQCSDQMPSDLKVGRSVHLL